MEQAAKTAVASSAHVWRLIQTAVKTENVGVDL